MTYANKVALYEYTTPPSGEVVTLALTKSNANIDHDDDDTLLAFYIDSAVEEVERLTNRILRPATIRAGYATYERARSEYAYYVEAQRAPIRSITSVERYNPDTEVYDTVPTDDYVIEQTSSFWRILFYPYVQLDALFSLLYLDQVAYPIRVTFEAGYLNPDSVPSKLKLAVMQYATWLYNNRGDCSDEELPPHLTKLIGGCRVLRVFG